MFPLVSILIPAYNAERFIASTIESALNQTWSNLEIVIVNDGSYDKTLSIAYGYQGENVKVLTGPNRGACAARNRALRESTGDYLQYLDADDLLAPDKIARQIDLLTRPESEGCIASAAWGRFWDDPTDSWDDPDSLWENLDPIEWAVRTMGRRQFIATAAWLVPRAVAERAGQWNEEIWPNPIDDAEYFFRVVMESKRVLFCAEAHSYYRMQHGGTLSALRTDAAWMGIFQTIEFQERALLRKEDSKRTRWAIAIVYKHFMFDSYPRVKALGRKARRRALELGDPNAEPQGGYYFGRLRRLIGWRAARHVQNAAFRVGYRALSKHRKEAHNKSKIEFRSDDI